MASTTSLVPTAQLPDNTLLKTDVLGRIKRTREQRERILDEYQRSGVSGAEFAAMCGVKYQTFANWVQCRKRQRNAHPKPPSERRTAKVQWLEAQVQTPGASSDTGLLLQLPGGAHARISSPQQVQLAAALVRALEKPC